MWWPWPVPMKGGIWKLWKKGKMKTPESGIALDAVVASRNNKKQSTKAALVFINDVAAICHNERWHPEVVAKMQGKTINQWQNTTVCVWHSQWLPRCLLLQKKYKLWKVLLSGICQDVVVASGSLPRNLLQKQ